MSNLGLIISSITEHISNVVHIGAGYCTESDLYKELGVNSVVFVEPDAQLFDTASKKFLQSPHITVLQRAIAGKSEERTYFRLSNKRFNSLLDPSRIFEYYPNITITDQTSVDAITLESLFDEIQLPEDINNLLVLELQGEELNVLAHTPDHVLQRFKWIVVRTSEHTLYGEPSATAGVNIKNSLRNTKFDALCFKEDNLVFCSYFFARNDAVLASQALEKEKQAALSNIKSLTKDNLKFSKQINNLTKKKKKLDTKVSETTDLLTATQAKLGDAHDQINDLTSGRYLLQSEIAESSDLLTATQTELGSVQDQVSELTNRGELLRIEITESADLLTKTKSELSNTHDQINELTNEKDQLQMEVSEASNLLRATQAELSSAHDHISNLTSAQKQLRQQVSDLSKTLQSTQSELSGLQVREQVLTSENTQQLLRIEELSRLNLEHSDELKEANYALRINNKLIAKTDADLRDLQTRYRTAVDNQTQQHTLLLELQDKLIQASKFYRQLNIQDQNIKGDIFNDDPEGIEREPNQIDKDKNV